MSQLICTTLYFLHKILFGINVKYLHFPAAINNYVQ